MNIQHILYISFIAISFCPFKTSIIAVL